MILLWMGHKHISAELQWIKFEVGISFLGEKKKSHKPNFWNHQVLKKDSEVEFPHGGLTESCNI